MTEEQRGPDQRDELRRRAEERLAAAAVDESLLSAGEARRLVHELQVHQIELELQNEELRRTQEELVASRDRYADLYDFAPVGYLTIDDKGMVQEANLTSASLLGTARGRLIGQFFSRFIAAEDQDTFFQHRRKVLASQERQLCELRLRRDDVTLFWAQLESRAQAGFSCRTALTDVTARRQAEEALRESEEKYRQLFATTPDAIVVFDAKTRKFVDANQACLQLYGYSREEFLKLRQPDITTEPEASSASINQTLEGAVAHLPLHYHRKKDGRVFPVEISAGIFLLGGRRLVYEVVRDITLRQQLEREVVRSHRLRAVGELAAGISHNLNNILTGVLLPAQVLQRRTHDPQLRQEIDTIHTAGLRARDLVHRLHLSVRGEMTSTLQPVAVDEVVQEVVSMTRPRWKDEPEAKGLAIEVVTQLGHPPPVRATSSELHGILTDLLLNAVEAMPKGGTIAIQTQSLERGAQLVFNDTGTGMDQERCQRVFEPFFTTKMEIGTGLGLSMAYGAVRRWGGTMTVDSAPGQGTTFTIQLPFWTAPEENP